MIPSAFEYAAPRTLDEALELLREHGDEAKVLAGGHSLLPLMKLRLAAPGLLIDLARVPDLSYVRDGGDHIAIGAMTTYYALESSELLRARVPLLSQAAGLVGDMQVRNRGTLGGALAHSDPAGDMPSVIKALRGELQVRGPDGEREVSADEFFVDLFESALQPDEILTEIRVPLAAGTPRQTYEKFRQRAADWAIVGVAVNVSGGNGTIDNASVVLTNVGTTPMRAVGVEEALNGRTADAETVQAAAARASEDLEPSGELKASAEFKLHLARVLTRRALERALGLQTA